MGKATGFLDFERQLPPKRPVAERLEDYKEFYEPVSDEHIRQQAARCMDCGVPFCHGGCPLGNIIPDWNDLVYNDQWHEAMTRLHATNNFPEFTGRLCPAPCEEACVLAINAPAVAIEFVEKSIVEHAFDNDWIKPEPPAVRTAKTVAVVGSGPAGMACAQQLNRAGHTVTVFERDSRIGGLLRYGIPDFKMEKRIIDRRLVVMEAEGIIFRTDAELGVNVPRAELDAFDAVVLCIGATVPRDMPVPGRDLDGVHFAMDFLTQQNKRGAGDDPAGFALPEISAEGKHVIVIGGGDTGSDCIGTSNRQKAASVTNFELLEEPTTDRPESQPWPYWPMRLRTSSSHEEGVDRAFAILTKELIGSGGKLEKLKTVNVIFEPPKNGGRPEMKEVEGSDKEWPADLVLLAMGFLGPDSGGVVSQLGLELDARSNIQCDDTYMSSKPGVFAAGDGRRGQSLIVWAISEGREAAHHVDAWLLGRPSELPCKGDGDLPRV